MLHALRHAEFEFHRPRVPKWLRTRAKTGGVKTLSSEQENDLPSPGSRVRVSLGYATLTVAQLAFLAYTAGVLTERLTQVGRVLEDHMKQQTSENLPSRVTLLEAQMLAEQRENANFRQEVRAQLTEIRELSAGRK